MSEKTEMLERLMQRKSSLTPAQMALLAKRLRGEEVGGGVDQRIPKRPIDSPAALSFAQQRLWFLDQLESGSATYNIPSVVRLAGVLLVDVLEQSLNEVVRRHEVLRTSIVEEQGEPVQRITDGLRLTLPVVDLRHLPETAREEELRALARQDAQQAFDLHNGPMMRATLLQMAEEEHVLLLSIHHIASDAWGLGVLIQEMSVIYAAYATGKSPQLPALSVQYADFAHWQRKHLQGEVLEKELSYWREQLGDKLPILQVPTDRPRSAVQTFAGAVHRFLIAEEWTDRLRALSKSEGTTLFMTVLALFNVLLYRYSGQEDLAVGTPVANRTRSEVEGLIGFFANTLVLRTRLSGEMTFRELLSLVRQVTLDAQEHQDVPFEKLVEELRPERSRSHSPLFQVMFVHFEDPLTHFALPKLTMQVLDTDSGTSKFDLTLDLLEKEEEVLGKFEYNTDLFDECTIARMTEHFLKLMHRLLEDPDQKIAQVDLISAEERERLLREWNNTESELAADLEIVKLFSQQVERTPDAVAVEFSGQSLTYRELNLRANQLAHYLQALGVGPDVCVGICLERSLQMIVGVLGILKAGGAYVALDPSYPPERLAFMLEDSSVPVVVTDRRLKELLPIGRSTAVMLDDDAEVIASYPHTEPEIGGDVDRLVYLIYTSGSTGQPKGVAMPQRPLVNLLAWQFNHFSINRPARVLQFTSLNFDVSFQEILSTLCAGGTLVLIGEDVRRDAVELLRIAERERVERLFLPFVALQQMAETGLESNIAPASLREIMTAGEQLQITPALAEWIGRLPGCVLHNQYGPSETHVVTALTLHGAPEAWPALPPIGKPIDNVQVYILDTNRCPVPVGVIGELYFGGVALARGYLNRPDLTEERFIADPFSADDTARLYKTGDLARWRSDGQIEYAGRADDQVKINGFRVELGEIESVLSQQEQVRACAVTTWEDASRQKRLVAHVVLHEQGVDHGELRSFLKERLPQYMVPAAIMVIDRLPLTPSGKVDRRSLPAPDQLQTETKSYVAPESEAEKRVAEIWGELLQLERVGRNDNFFDLGGHSLLATKLISRIRTAFGVEMPVGALFQSPTLQAVGEYIERGIASGKAAAELPMKRISREQPLPLSFAQQRLWLLDRLAPGQAVYNMPFSVRFDGQLHIEALERSLNQIICRHESLRTVFIERDHRPLMRICPFTEQHMQVIDLCDLPAGEREREMERLICRAAAEPFDLSAGPLVRFALLKVEERAHILLLNLHHIVFDGWSIGVFTKELSALYQQLAAGGEAALPDLPIQYADYAGWQHQQLTPAVLEEQLAYWKDQLGGDLPALELPTDRPRPPVQTYRGDIATFVLPPDLVKSLTTLSQSEGVTLFMTLLAAYQTLLARYSGQTDLCVGTPIAGRNREETENLIGCFINMLTLRTQLDGQPTFAELLQRVRAVTLGAYAHQDIPFEKLVEELQPMRDRSRSPLFQTMFILQNAPLGPIELPGVQITLLDPRSEVAKYDLSFSLFESAAGLTGSVEYNCDLYDKTTIERLIAHFSNLLYAVAADPVCNVFELNLFTPEEREQLLFGWNETQVEYELAPSISAQFERQAARVPERLAVIAAGEGLTYRELNERANRVTHHLRSCGIKRDQVVAICLERSAEMLVAILGVLKAGGAYLPLDPDYPLDRLVYMWEDSGASWLLTRSGTAKGMSIAGTGESIDLAELPADLPTHNPELVNEPHDLAYLIYTSGSTGRPKGTLLEHRGVLNLASWMNASYQFTDDEVMGQYFSFSFDGSVFETFSALLSGVSLYLLTGDERQDVHRFADAVARERLSSLTLPTAFFNQLSQLLTAEDVDKLANLKRVWTAGEALTGEAVAAWQSRLGRRIELINAYGPTEATVCVSLFAIDELWDASRSRVPIGRPLANVQMYVLTAELEPCPINVVGEIFIGGIGLARGYLNQPERTNEMFIPDPFAQQPGARLYRTGDFGRFLPDGAIEYVGRRDSQVKIRGYRIDLGEIRAALQAHPQIREVEVIAREIRPGDRRVLAYFLPQSAEGVDLAELRRYAKRRLPEHMVPAAFVRLTDLPMTANGKVDHRALPQPTIEDMRESPYVAPRNKLEAQLAAIWSELLQVEQVGIHDNFFDLGGHSLLATQIASRIRQDFSVELPVSALFEANTVAELALLFEERQLWTTTADLAMTRAPREGRRRR